MRYGIMEVLHLNKHGSWATVTRRRWLQIALDAMLDQDAPVCGRYGGYVPVDARRKGPASQPAPGPSTKPSRSP